jgi:hypothetical protein
MPAMILVMHLQCLILKPHFLMLKAAWLSWLKSRDSSMTFPTLTPLGAVKFVPCDHVDHQLHSGTTARLEDDWIIHLPMCSMGINGHQWAMVNPMIMIFTVIITNGKSPFK